MLNEVEIDDDLTAIDKAFGFNIPKRKPVKPSTSETSREEIDAALNGEHGQRFRDFFAAVKKAEGGQPDIIVGGQKRFDVRGDHPNIVGLRTAEGQSTASGDYQITGSNWYGSKGRKGLKHRLGASSFDPDNQLRGAMMLFGDRGRRNGVDVFAAIRDGDYDTAINIAQQDWAALPGSNLHKGQNKRMSRDEFLRLARGSGASGIDLASIDKAFGFNDQIGDLSAIDKDFGFEDPRPQTQGPSATGLEDIDAAFGYQPTASQNNVVPEALETIKAQADAAMNLADKNRVGVLTTSPEQNAVFGNLSGFQMVDIGDGKNLWVNTEKARKQLRLRKPEDVERFFKTNKDAIQKYTGTAVNVGDDTTQGPTVLTTAPNGTELSAKIVDTPENAIKQVAIDQTSFPQGQSEIVDAQDVVARRSTPVEGFAEEIIDPNSMPAEYPASTVQPIQPDSDLAQALGVRPPAVKAPISDQSQVVAAPKKTAQPKQPQFNEKAFKDANANLKSVGQPELTREQFIATQIPTSGSTVEISANPSDFTIDGQALTDFEVEEQSIGGGTFRVPKELGKAGASDGIAGIYRPTDTMSAEEAARNAYLAAGRRYGATTENWDRYKTTQAGQRFIAENPVNDGSQIQVTYKALEDGGVDVATQRRMEEAQSRTDLTTPKDLQVGYDTQAIDAEWLNKNAGRVLLGPALPLFDSLPEFAQKGLNNIGSSVVGGVFQSGAEINDNLAGIARPFVNDDIFQTMKGVSDRGKDFVGKTGDGGITSEIFKFAGATPGRLSKYYLLTRIPKVGVVTAMALDAGTMSSGRGDSPLQVLKETAKGAAFGSVFKAAPLAGVLISANTKNVIPHIASTAGTIFLGTAAVAQIAGDSEKQALISGGLNALMYLAGRGLEMRGKTARMRDQNGKTVDVKVDPNGEVKLLKGSVKKPDVEVYTETVLGKDGVYRAKGDTSVDRVPENVGNRGNRLEGGQNQLSTRTGNPIANPNPSGEVIPLKESGTEARRIDTPDPAAINALSDKRSRKVIDALKGKDFTTIADLAKATRLDPVNVEDVALKLYGAGMAELMPGNRIRLIDSPETAKATDIFEKAATYGQAPIAPTQTTSAVKSNTSITQPSQPTQPKPDAELVERETQRTPPKEYEAGPTTTAEQTRIEGRQNVDGVEYVRQESIDSPSGRGGKIRFADAEPDPTFKFRIIEAGQLQPADLGGNTNYNHFLQEAQPKDRSTAASKNASDKIAQSPDLEQVADAPNAYSGAPVINARGEVIQGNNRSEGLKKHYGIGGTSYKEDLKKNAERFGFTADQIDGMKEPVLVRQIDVDDDAAIRLGQYKFSDLESGGSIRIDPITTSARIPHSEKSRMVEDIFRDAPDDMTLTELIRKNRSLIKVHLDPFLTDTQKETLDNANREFTPNAVKDIAGVFKHFLFDKGDVDLPDLFETLPYHAKEALTASLPKIFSVSQENSIVPELQNAILAASEFSATGSRDYEAWKRQPDMVSGTPAPMEIYTPAELVLADKLLNAKSQQEVKDIFGQYAKVINGHSGDLFDEAREPQSKATAIKEVFGVDHAERRKNDAGQDPRRETEVDGEQGDQTAEPARPTEQRAADTTGDTEQAERLTRTLDDLTPAEKSALRRDIAPVANQGKGKLLSDAARAYGLPQSEVAKLPPLPEVGQYGQTSHFIKSSLSSEANDELYNAFARIFAPNELRDIEPEFPEISDRGNQATNIVDAIALDMDYGRSSQMDADAWGRFLDKHGERLGDEGINLILSALDHQQDWHRNIIRFISDPELLPLKQRVYELGDIAGLEGFVNPRWGAIKPPEFDASKPSFDFKGDPTLKKEALRIGRKYGIQQGRGEGGLSDAVIKQTFLRAIRQVANEALAIRTGDGAQPAANQSDPQTNRPTQGRRDAEELAAVSPYATEEGRLQMAEARRNALIEEYGLDPVRDKEIIDALDRQGFQFSDAFDQVNLFGEKLTPRTEQPSLFSKLNANSMQAAMEDASRTNLEKVLGKDNATYLQRIFDQPESVQPRAYRAAVKISDGQYIIAAKGLQDIANDAVDALDTYNYAQSVNATIDDLLPQQSFSGETYSDRLTPQSIEFAKSIEQGDFAIVFNKALNDAPSDAIRFADDNSNTKPSPSASDRDRAKESQTARRLSAAVRNNSDAVNTRLAQFAVDGNNVLRATNMAGLKIVSDAMKMIQDNVPNFSGFYLDKGQTFLLRRAFQHARFNALSNRQKQAADAIGKTIAYIDQATDPDHGDLTFAIDIPELPLMSKVSDQEERAHRANARTKARETFVTIAETDAIKKALANLSPAYAKMSVTGRVDEVLAKSFRDDAETELALSKPETRAVRKAFFAGLKNSGVTATDYAEQIANVSRTGAAFARYANRTNQLEQRPLNDDATGTGEESDPLYGLRETRRQGTRDSRGLAGSDPDRFAKLRQTELSSADRSEDGGVDSTALAVRTPADILFSTPKDMIVVDAVDQVEKSVGLIEKYIYDGKRDVSLYEAAANTIRAGYLLGFSVIKTNLVGNTGSVVTEQAAKPFMATADILNSKFNPKAEGRRHVPGLAFGDVIDGLFGKTGVLREGLFGERGMIQGILHGVGDIEASRVDMNVENPENPNFVRNTGVVPLDALLELTKRLTVTIDRPFKAYARTAEMRGLSRVTAKNLVKEQNDRRGVASLFDQRWRKIAKEIRKDPSLLMRDMAERYAETLTFQNPNPVTESYEKVKRTMTNPEALAKFLPATAESRLAKHTAGLAHVGITSAVPFLKTPANVGIRALEYFAPTGIISAAWKFSRIGEGFERSQWMKETAEHRAKVFKAIVKERRIADKAFREDTRVKMSRYSKQRQAKLDSYKELIADTNGSTVLTDKAKRERIAKIREARAQWLDSWRTARDKYTSKRAKEMTDIDNRRRVADMKTRDEWEAEDMFAEHKFDAFDNKAFAEAAGRAGFGATIGGLFLLGVIQGMIDAVGVTDYDDEKGKWYAKRAAGIPDSSVNVGGYRFQYNKSPFGSAVNIGLNQIEQFERPGSRTSRTGTMASRFGKDLLNLSPLTNSQFEKEDLNSWIGSKATSITPLINFKVLQEVGEVLDDQPRKYWDEGFLPQYMIKIPGLRETLPASKTPLGGPDERGNMTRRFLRMLDPLNTVKEKRSQRTLPVTPLKK